MKTAADIFDQVSAHADHVMLSFPPGTPAQTLLAVRSSAVASTIVTLAASLLRGCQHAMACDLILLAGDEIERFRKTISAEEMTRITREILGRANARARANGDASFLDPNLLITSLGGQW